jgi:hypothetical protein
MQPIYPDTWELANAVQAHGAKLQPISWGNQEKHRYLLPGRPDGRPDGGRSSLACAALDAELDSTSRRRTRQLRKMQFISQLLSERQVDSSLIVWYTSRRRTRQLRKMQFISELLSERQVDSSLIVWYTSRRRVGPCRHRGWSISRRVVSLGEHLQPHAGRSPRNSGGTTATECLVGSECLWPVLGGGGQARLLRPRRRGWWARTAGQGRAGPDVRVRDRGRVGSVRPERRGQIDASARRCLSGLPESHGGAGIGTRGAGLVQGRLP